MNNETNNTSELEQPEIYEPDQNKSSSSSPNPEELFRGYIISQISAEEHERKVMEITRMLSKLYRSKSRLERKARELRYEAWMMYMEAAAAKTEERILGHVLSKMHNLGPNANETDHEQLLHDVDQKLHERAMKLDEKLKEISMIVGGLKNELLSVAPGERAGIKEKLTGLLRAGAILEGKLWGVVRAAVKILKIDAMAFLGNIDSHYFEPELQEPSAELESREVDNNTYPEPAPQPPFVPQNVSNSGEPQPQPAPSAEQPPAKQLAQHSNNRKARN